MRRASPHKAVPRSDTHDLLAFWRELTRQANAAFDRGEFAEAQRGYRQALKLAVTLVEGPGLDAAPDDCLVALVVTHHNLAEAYRRNRDAERACEQLCLAHRALGRVACDPRASSETRHCALRHSGRTRLALLDWQTVHGHCPNTESALRDGARSISSARGIALH